MHGRFSAGILRNVKQRTHGLLSSPRELSESNESLSIGVRYHQTFLAAARLLVFYNLRQTVSSSKESILGILGVGHWKSRHCTSSNTNRYEGQQGLMIADFYPRDFN